MKYTCRTQAVLAVAAMLKTDDGYRRIRTKGINSIWKPE